MSDHRDAWKRIHGITDERTLDAVEAMGRQLDALNDERLSLAARIAELTGALEEIGERTKRQDANEWDILGIAGVVRRALAKDKGNG